MAASGRQLVTSRVGTAIAVVLSLLFAAKLSLFTTGIRAARRVLVHYGELSREPLTGCTVLCLNYPTPALDRQYDLDRLYFRPSYHAVDNLARAKRCFSWGELPDTYRSTAIPGTTPQRVSF